jgi:hypothetical protein
MSRILTLIIILFFTSVENTFAYTPKEGNISAVFGPFFYRTRFADVSPELRSPHLGGIAFIAIGDISNKGSLELGFFHMNKLYFRQSNGLFVAEKTQLMHITMGYRRWWKPKLSTSVTVFSAYSMGELETEYTDFSSPSAQPKTSATDKVEYGIDLALQYELYAEGRWALVTDLRYSLPVTSKSQESSEHYGIILGLRYFIQEKQKAGANPP